MSGIIFEYVELSISGGKRFLERQRKNRLQSSGGVNKYDLKRRLHTYILYHLLPKGAFQEQSITG